MEESEGNIKIYEIIEDSVVKMGKFGVNMLPGVGPPLALMLDLFFGSPAELRIKEAMIEMGQRIKYLEENHQLDIDSLSTNQQFIDVVMQVTPLYIKTSVKQKREALLNAISNTAIGRSPGESKALVFIRTLDSITADHLRIIRFLGDPDKYAYGFGSAFSGNHLHTHTLATLKLIFTDLAQDEAYLKFLWKDLGKLEIHQSAGLITGSSSDGVDLPVLTSFGKEFLAFIRFDE